MTLLDAPKAMPAVDEAQLLFQEARARRRRRWLAAGISSGVVAAVLVAALGTALGRHSGAALRPTAPVDAAAAGAHATVSFSVRPVLCYAPAFTLAPGQPASTGPLPGCSPPSRLTAANLNVTVPRGQATAGSAPGAGFSFGNPAPDAAFSSYPSTAPARAGAEDVVLLPGGSELGGTRFVLGPAAVTRSGIASARAVDASGNWEVDVTLTPSASLQWDRLARQQFHALVGVVVNGVVVSAPIVEAGQASFTSFSSGRLQIAAGFTAAQAKALAAGL